MKMSKDWLKVMKKSRVKRLSEWTQLTNSVSFKWKMALCTLGERMTKDKWEQVPVSELIWLNVRICQLRLKCKTTQIRSELLRISLWVKEQC
jgi:hypothetical protein